MSRRLLLTWFLPCLLLLSGCGAASSPGYQVQRNADGTLAGVVVTLRVLDRREAVAAYQPALLVFRDGGYVRWVNLSSNLRELVIKDAFEDGRLDPAGDTFVLDLDQKGKLDYACSFGYSARSPLLVSNYRQTQTQD